MDRIENHNNSLNNENENSLELFSNINFPQNLTNDSYAYLLQDNTFIAFINFAICKFNPLKDFCFFEGCFT